MQVKNCFNHYSLSTCNYERQHAVWECGEFSYHRKVQISFDSTKTVMNTLLNAKSLFHSKFHSQKCLQILIRNGIQGCFSSFAPILKILAQFFCILKPDTVLTSTHTAQARWRRFRYSNLTIRFHIYF